jgi:heme oxygenase
MYQLVLVAYFHFYRAVEAAIDRSLAAQSLDFSYEPRRKLQWIRADLLHFGINPEEDRFKPAVPVGPLDILDAGQLVGLLYTIEGSSMGGQVISGFLASNLALSPKSGARFFYGYGDQVVSFWNQFEAFMDATLTGDAIQSRANDSARSTFAMMESILDEYATRHAH